METFSEADVRNTENELSSYNRRWRGPRGGGNFRRGRGGPPRNRYRRTRR